MNFHVTVQGGHEADIAITMGADGHSFSGTVLHSDMGEGVISNGVKTGTYMQADLAIGSHKASLTATLDGENISGRISVGWLGWNFSGTETA